MTATVFVNGVTLTDAPWFNDGDSIIYPGGGTTLTGAWTSVAFSAGNFTGNGSMTWTVASGDQDTFKYMILNKTMWVSFSIVTSTVAGTPNTDLRIAIPGGKTAASNASNKLGFCLDNNVKSEALVSVSTSANTLIVINRSDLANWTASADQTRVSGQIFFEIN